MFFFFLRIRFRCLRRLDVRQAIVEDDDNDLGEPFGKKEPGYIFTSRGATNRQSDDDADLDQL